MFDMIIGIQGPCSALCTMKRAVDFNVKGQGHKGRDVCRHLDPLYVLVYVFCFQIRTPAQINNQVVLFYLFSLLLSV